jgi:hypothetical protein
MDLLGMRVHEGPIRGDIGAFLERHATADPALQRAQLVLGEIHARRHVQLGKDGTQAVAIKKWDASGARWHMASSIISSGYRIGNIVAAGLLFRESLAESYMIGRYSQEAVPMRRTACLLLSLILSSAASSSHAAPKIDAARIGVDCKDDFQKLCKGEPGGSMLECMQRHRAEVGEACRAAMDAGKGAGAAASGKRPPSCKDDYVRVCKGAKSGELKACLKAHRKELSDFCRKIFDMTQSKETSAAH